VTFPAVSIWRRKTPGCQVAIPPASAGNWPCCPAQFHRSFVDGLDGNYPFELEDVSTCILGFNNNMLDNIWIIILVDNIGYFDVQQ